MLRCRRKTPPCSPHIHAAATGTDSAGDASHDLRPAGPCAHDAQPMPSAATALLREALHEPKQATGSTRLSLIRHPLQGPVEAQSLVRLLAEALGLLTIALWLLWVMTNLCWEDTEVWRKNSGYRDLHRGAGRSIDGAGLVAAGLVPTCPSTQQLPAHLLWTQSSLALSGLLRSGILAFLLSLIMSPQHAHCLFHGGW